MDNKSYVNSLVKHQAFRVYSEEPLGAPTSADSRRILKEEEEEKTPTTKAARKNKKSSH